MAAASSEKPPPPKPLTTMQKLSTGDKCGIIVLLVVMLFSFGMLGLQLADYEWLIFNDDEWLCVTGFHEKNTQVQGFDEDAEKSVLRMYYKWKFDEHRVEAKKLYTDTRRSSLDEKVKRLQKGLRNDFTGASNTKLSKDSCNVTATEFNSKLVKKATDDTFKRKEKHVEMTTSTAIAKNALKLDEGNLVYSDYTCFHALSHGVDAIERALHHKYIKLNANVTELANTFTSYPSFNATMCSVQCVTKGKDKNNCYASMPNADGTKPANAGNAICEYQTKKSYKKDRDYCDFVEYTRDFEKSAAASTRIVTALMPVLAYVLANTWC